MEKCSLIGDKYGHIGDKYGHIDDKWEYIWDKYGHTGESTVQYSVFSTFCIVQYNIVLRT